MGAGAALAGQGWQVDVQSSESQGHGTALAREAAAQGADVIFACGGDGTLNEVINGVAGTEAAAGVIRAGMGNVFAKEIGVPWSPERALSALTEGEVRRFDLGWADGRAFLLMAGVGLDALAVKHTPFWLKRRVGSAALIIQGLRELPAYRSRRVALRLNGVEQEADLYWLLLGNTRSYGGVINIASGALADDGLLDAYVYVGRSLPRLLTTAMRIAAGRAATGGGVRFERVKSLELMTPGLAVQVDGEYIGETPMRFSVERQALPVLLPRGQGRQLLGEISNK